MSKTPHKPCVNRDTSGLCVLSTAYRADRKAGLQCDKSGRCVDVKIAICSGYFYQGKGEAEIRRDQHEKTKAMCLLAARQATHTVNKDGVCHKISLVEMYES